ncbi:hypothetical protein QYE76_014301 [Lolium multiflorum]|uniref:C2H2-type domain-containing protein n=1 Tax=Lolium multiflorum TaxID=4521 RepID=A0AAD8U5V3_LOLMU|nr:hypothetical protein QYE76_014301 [Lolium multiflorum]
MTPLLERQHATGTESAHTGDAQITPPPTPGGQEGSTAKAAPAARSRRRPGGDDAAEGAFVCRTCSRRFPSFQALGGHRTGHTRLQARHALPPRQQRPARAAHECAVCGLEFAMGQALGGHMRRHKQQQADAPACAEVVVVEAGERKEDAVDSNGAPPLEDRRGGDIREGCSSRMGQALGGHMRRHKQQAVAASVDVDDEGQRNEEEALNSSCEDRRGGDREGCTSGQVASGSGSGSGPEPRLLNLLV